MGSGYITRYVCDGQSLASPRQVAGRVQAFPKLPDMACSAPLSARLSRKVWDLRISHRWLSGTSKNLPLTQPQFGSSKKRSFELPPRRVSCSFVNLEIESVRQSTSASLHFSSKFQQTWKFFLVGFLRAYGWDREHVFSDFRQGDPKKKTWRLPEQGRPR